MTNKDMKQMARFEIDTNTRDEYYWRFRANNNKIIAVSSEGYRTKSDCQHSIDLIKRLGPTAPVVDLTTSGSIFDP